MSRWSRYRWIIRSKIYYTLSSTFISTCIYLSLSMHHLADHVVFCSMLTCCLNLSEVHPSNWWSWKIMIITMILLMVRFLFAIFVSMTILSPFEIFFVGFGLLHFLICLLIVFILMSLDCRFCFTSLIILSF